MAYFKAKIGDTTYELAKLTLGDSQTLKHRFGVSDLTEMSSTDPDVIVGLLTLAVRKADPTKTLDQALAEVQEFDIEDFKPAEDAKEPEADAGPLADDAVVTSDPSVSGNLETIPPTPGDPNTPTS